VVSTTGAMTVRAETSPWWRVALAAGVWTSLYLLIEPLSRWIAYGLAGLPRGSHLGDAVAFFFYDVPKILLLLSGMIFVITVVRSFFSAERARRLLSGKRVGLGNVISIDMGGTTAKASVIEDGQIKRTGEFEIGGALSQGSRLYKGGGYLLRVPAIDIAEVGAGGGSIVSVDGAGALHDRPVFSITLRTSE